MVINRRPHEVQAVSFVHEHGDSVNFEFLVLFSLLVKAQDVTHSGTAASTNAHAQPIPVRNALFPNDLSDLFRRSWADLNRSIRFGCGGRSHKRERSVGTEDEYRAGGRMYDPFKTPVPQPVRD